MDSTYACVAQGHQPILMYSMSLGSINTCTYPILQIFRPPPQTHTHTRAHFLIRTGFLLNKCSPPKPQTWGCRAMTPSSCTRKKAPSVPPVVGGRSGPSATRGYTSSTGGSQRGRRRGEGIFLRFRRRGFGVFFVFSFFSDVFTAAMLFFESSFRCWFVAFGLTEALIVFLWHIRRVLYALQVLFVG